MEAASTGGVSSEHDEPGEAEERNDVGIYQSSVYLFWANQNSDCFSWGVYIGSRLFAETGPQSQTPSGSVQPHVNQIVHPQGASTVAGW